MAELCQSSHAPLRALVEGNQARKCQHTASEDCALHAVDDVLHIDLLVRVVRLVPLVVDLHQELH